MKFKYSIIAVFIVIISVTAFRFKYSSDKEKNISKMIKETVYFYDDQTLKLSNIKLYAIYALPQTKKNQLKNNWQNLIKEALNKAKLFHQIQFRNRSKIDYEIYPQIIVLDDTPSQIGFDSLKLSEFLKIVENIEKKLVRELLKLKDDSYKILVIFYEGEGAFGAVITDKSDLLNKYKSSLNVVTTTIENFNGIAFISLDYLNKPYGESILYHEIAHTFGIPDAYQNNKDFSLDIMGNGRFLPLEINYLDYETINKMIH